MHKFPLISKTTANYFASQAYWLWFHRGNQKYKSYDKDRNTISCVIHHDKGIVEVFAKSKDETTVYRVECKIRKTWQH